MQGWSTSICCRNVMYKYIYTNFGLHLNNMLYLGVKSLKFLKNYVEAHYAYLKKIAIFGKAKTPNFFQRMPYIYFLRFKLEILTTHRNIMVLGD